MEKLMLIKKGQANQAAREDIESRTALKKRAQYSVHSGRFIWYERDAPLAVIVNAANEEEAKQKVLDDIADPDDTELRSTFESEYGSTWFLKSISGQEL